MSLLVTTAADVIISKGFGDKPAIQYYEGENPSMRFRIGVRVYDSREESNYRWINMAVKAFGAVCERTKKMKLKEGSFITIVGRQDEDHWRDENGQECFAPVIIADIIEYSGGNGRQNGQSGNTANPNTQNPLPSREQRNEPSAEDEPPTASSEQTQLPENFTRYQGFSLGDETDSPYFPRENP